MGPTVVDLVAGIIGRIEDRPPGPGRPPMPTAEAIETLRFFLRGVQWRELQAADGRASGSTLRRRLDKWHTTTLLRRVHAVLFRMARSGLDAAAWDVVVNSYSVRAKHGKSGTKYHVVVSTDGLPLAVMPSAANVHDTRLFPDLLRLAQVVCTAIGRLYTDAGYDSADNRWLCLRDGVQPHIRKTGEPPGLLSRQGPMHRRCTDARGCSQTSAWIDDRIGWGASSSLTASMHSENRLLA